MSPVTLACPERKITLIAADDLDAPIGRPTVDDNILEGAITLGEHGPECRVYVLDLIERGRHHRDSRQPAPCTVRQLKRYCGILSHVGMVLEMRGTVQAADPAPVDLRGRKGPAPTHPSVTPPEGPSPPAGADSLNGMPRPRERG